MGTRSPDRTGVLIVRLWLEASHETRLRARITRSLDSVAGGDFTSVVSSADGICDVVKQWVDDFIEP